MEGIGGIDQDAGYATAAKAVDRPPRGEVYDGLEVYESRCAQLEAAVERVFETFGPVLGPIADDGPTTVAALELKVPASTNVGSSLLTSNERFGRLIASLNTACEACRI